MPRPISVPSAGPVFRVQRPSRVWPRSLLRHVGLLLGVSLALVFGFGVLLWSGLGRPDLTGRPTPTSSTPTGSGPAGSSPGGALSVTERLEALKVVLAVVGGIGAIVALTVAYRKQRDGEIAEYREDTKAFAERFGRAVDQLGHTEHAVRTGGVYALAELADEWADGRQMCIDVLCAYLRMPYEADPAAAGYSAGNKEVRRILIRVIRNHLRDGWSAVSWRGYRFSFEGAVFDCGDLSRTTLTGGNMTFHGARFVSGWFEFDGVAFAGTPVWFTNVEFAGARVTFRGARFDGSPVKFDRAQVTDGVVAFDNTNFNTGTVSFRAVDVTGGAVSFTGAARNCAAVDWGPFPAVDPNVTP